MDARDFPMTTQLWPGSATMSDRTAAIRDEMSAAVRALGGEDQLVRIANSRAARATGLPITTVSRLRFRKIARIPADVADAVREAMLRHLERQAQKARHEADLLRARLSHHQDLDRAAAAAGGADVGVGGAAAGAVAG
jgi:hypothetical protein